MNKAVFVDEKSMFDVSRFAFGKHPEDRWFRQPDVEKFFSGTLQRTHDDMVCVYEESQAYPSTVSMFTKLVSKRSCANELKTFGWWTPPKEVRKIYSVDRRRFLTPAFCEFSSLEWCLFPQPDSGSAYTDQNGRRAAIKSVSKGAYGHSYLIFIRRNLLGSYVEKFDCRLITYLRINRYSERCLKDWGIRNRNKIRRSSSSFHYELEFCELEQRLRPLCPSCSFTIGKRDITDDVVASAITHKR